MMKRYLLSAAALMAAVSISTAAGAEAQIDAPETPATAIHGAPANTPGFGGSSANPNGVGKNGGGGIHNIAAAPGQGGANEVDDRPAGNMHGGLAATTGYSK